MEPERPLLLIEADHLWGVEAVPAAWVPRGAGGPPALSAKGAVALSAKSQMPPSAVVPRPAPAMAVAPPRQLPPAAVREAGALKAGQRPAPPAWSFHAEGAVQPRVLFMAVEWGATIEGEVRALFDRQVAAMKLAPENIGLARAVWTGDQEPADLGPVRTRLLARIDETKPEALVLFGGFAVRALLGGAGSLSLARGRLHRLADRPAVATWHPSQLGVDRQRRAEAWSDLQLVMRELGLA